MYCLHNSFLFCTINRIQSSRIDFYMLFLFSSDVLAISVWNLLILLVLRKRILSSPSLTYLTSTSSCPRYFVVNIDFIVLGFMLYSSWMLLFKKYGLIGWISLVNTYIIPVLNNACSVLHTMKLYVGRVSVIPCWQYDHLVYFKECSLVCAPFTLG
jgi:hypothetical protein